MAMTARITVMVHLMPLCRTERKTTNQIDDMLNISFSPFYFGSIENLLFLLFLSQRN